MLRKAIIIGMSHFPSTATNRMSPINRRSALALGLAAWAGHGLAAPGSGVVDETWTDTTRQRDVPVKVRWPVLSAGTVAQAARGQTVVLFSHGLGGTREGGAVWGEAWAAAGFVVVHVQHPGSDLPAVRAAAGVFTNREGLRSVAGAQQLQARLGDIRFVLDEMTRRHHSAEPGWANVKVQAVGMSGHSFGAHTTLGMAGQSYPGLVGVNEPRLAAFIALSPSVPVTGDATAAFAPLTRPVLCLTGTRDGDVVGNGATPERRMAVFTALPAGQKAQLLLQDADHMTFGGQTGRAAEIVPREPITRTLQARHHALVAAITTDWWRATLLGDAAATARLAHPQGLNAGDTWQQK